MKTFKRLFFWPFFCEQGFDSQQVSLGEGVYQISVPQATATIIPIPAAGITVDGSETD